MGALAQATWLTGRPVGPQSKVPGPNPQSKSPVQIPSPNPPDYRSTTVTNSTGSENFQRFENLDRGFGLGIWTGDLDWGFGLGTSGLSQILGISFTGSWPAHFLTLDISDFVDGPHHICGCPRLNLWMPPTKFMDGPNKIYGWPPTKFMDDPT